MQLAQDAERRALAAEASAAQAAAAAAAARKDVAHLTEQLQEARAEGQKHAAAAITPKEGQACVGVDLHADLLSQMEVRGPSFLVPSVPHTLTT